MTLHPFGSCYENLNYYDKRFKWPNSDPPLPCRANWIRLSRKKWKWIGILPGHFQATCRNVHIWGSPHRKAGILLLMHALISGWNITIPSILSPLPHLRSKLSLQHMSKVALTAMSLFILPFRLNQYLRYRFKAACVWFNSIYQSERIWQTILRSVPLFWSHIIHRPTSCDVILKSSSTLRRSIF